MVYKLNRIKCLLERVKKVIVNPTVDYLYMYYTDDFIVELDVKL